ncbi:hypothetical protein JHK87_048686 [Glycine soja]|nr:hypothetical protein JHK87_048686 [Glycine soja]
MARSGEKSFSDPLSFTNVQYFWLRLESMRRSKLRLGKTPSSDHVLAELSALLDMDAREEEWTKLPRPTFVEGSCNHSCFVSSRENERLSQGTIICLVCKRPMKKLVVYQP